MSHAQLSWASAWYLRSETYADALTRIIDAHHALPFASVWGSASRTSSDGQFFASGRNAGEINAKYGPDPGLKIYSFLSERYSSFHSNVIGATAGEAPFVLDGLVSNAARAARSIAVRMSCAGTNAHRPRCRTASRLWLERVAPLEP